MARTSSSVFDLVKHEDAVSHASTCGTFFNLQYGMVMENIRDVVGGGESAGGAHAGAGGGVVGGGGSGGVAETGGGIVSGGVGAEVDTGFKV